MKVVPPDWDSPLRIVQLVETLELGGLERVVVDLASEQQRTGHRVTILCYFDEGPLANIAKTAGVDVIALHRTKGFTSASLRALVAAIRTLRPDILHTHGNSFHHYGVAAALGARVPVLVNTRHGSGAWHISLTHRCLYWASVPFTDAFIGCARAVQDRLLRLPGLSRSKALVVPNGIRLDRFFPTPEDPPPGPALRFGTVGNLRDEKDHATLIRAFARVRAALPGATLRIVGRGQRLSAIEKQIQDLSLSGAITLEESNDTAPFYREIDVFVLSSVTEGMPLVVMEAMASGLPIVSTRVGGVPEIAPEHSVASYCPSKDPAALAQIMLATALDPNLPARRAAARRYALLHFSHELMQLRYLSVYRQLSRARSARLSTRSARTHTLPPLSPPSDARG
jgi:glycosyltransferase involved in cell wall biosynthesis